MQQEEEGARQEEEKRQAQERGLGPREAEGRNEAVAAEREAR